MRRLLLRVSLIRKSAGLFKITIFLVIVAFIFADCFLLYSARVLSPKHHCKVFSDSVGLLIDELGLNRGKYLLYLVNCLIARSSMLVVVVSRLLYRESKVTTIAILSQMFWFDVIVNHKHFIKNQTLAYQLIIDFSNLFGFFFRRKFRSSWSIELTTLYLTFE